MGKSGFWLRGAKGKLAGTVLYQSGGRTLQREIVTPKNPQTMGQMSQRVVFATAAKFYQDAQQNRFVLAFAGKKPYQSAFNMFMKENLKAGIKVFPTQEQVNDPAFCACAPWIVSTGNLQSIPVAEVIDRTEIIGAAICFTDDAGNYLNSWDEVIAANTSLNLKYGDIITVTAVVADMHLGSGPGNYDIILGERAPLWVTRQFIIGANLGDGTLEDYMILNGFAEFTPIGGSQNKAIGIDLSVEWGSLVAYREGENDDLAVMCCVTRSRVEKGKTEVSFSQMHLTPTAMGIHYALNLDEQAEYARRSYMKSTPSSYPTEVLQGSVAVDPDNAYNLNYTKSDGNKGQRTSFPATNINAYGVRGDEECVGYIEVDFSVLNSLDDIQVVWTTGQSYVRRGIVPISEGLTRKRAVIELHAPLSTAATGQTFTVKVQGKNLASGSMTFPSA